MKIFICGEGRHGKDTVAEIAKDGFGLTHESSSHLAMRIFLREELARDYGLVYETEEECYTDRVNHRMLWMQRIRAYNEGDLTRLSRAIFEHCNIYVGIRNREEFLEARHLANLAIWVDASKRLPDSSDPSNSILPEDCDIVIENNGTEEELVRKVDRLFAFLTAGTRAQKFAQVGFTGVHIAKLEELTRMEGDDMLHTVETPQWDDEREYPESD